jgi:RNA polymerase sigma factor (sigma-70 family)
MWSGVVADPSLRQELAVYFSDIHPMEDLHPNVEDLIKGADLRGDFIEGTLLPPPIDVDAALENPYVVKLHNDCRVETTRIDSVASKMTPRGVLLFNILMLHGGAEVSYDELDRLETLEYNSRSRYESTRIHARSRAARDLGKLYRGVEFSETGCKLADNLVIIDKRTKDEQQVPENDDTEQRLGDVAVAEAVTVAPAEEPAVEQAPIVKPETPPFTDFGSTKDRVREFSAAVSQYREHPKVAIALAELRSEVRGEHMLGVDSKQQFMHESNAYAKILDAEAIESLFQRIEMGMGVVQRLKSQGDALPSTAEEQQLIDLTIAANTLILHTLNLVPSRFDGKFAKHRLMRDELMQEGNIGLWNAVMSFDYKQGSEKFISYALTFVDRSIIGALARERRAAGMSDGKYKQWAKLQRVRADLLKDLTRDPTDEEVAAKLGISLEELEDLDNSGVVYYESLDMKLDASEDDSATFGDRVADESAAQALEQVERELDAPYIRNLVTKAGLPARDQLLISLFYGVYMPHLSGMCIDTGMIEIDYDTAFEKLKDVEKVSNRDVAFVCGLAESSANTLKWRAMKLVREALTKSPDLEDAQILGGSWALSELLPAEAVAAMQEQWGLPK